MCKFVHHSSLQHLRQCSPTHTHTHTLSGLVLQVLEHLVRIHLLFFIVALSLRNIHGDRHALDLFASYSSLGFCLIRIQNHVDISKCTDIGISHGERQRCRFPCRGAIRITLQHQRCVYTYAFLKGSGPPRYTSTLGVINPLFSMVPGSFSGLSFKLLNGKFKNTMFLTHCNLVLED